MVIVRFLFSDPLLFLLRALRHSRLLLVLRFLITFLRLEIMIVVYVRVPDLRQLEIIVVVF